MSWLTKAQAAFGFEEKKEEVVVDPNRQYDAGDIIYKEGMLSKKGDTVKFYRQRRFVLRRSTLCYYDGNTLKGTIEFEGYSAGVYDAQSFIFSLNPPTGVKRTYFIMAADEKEMYTWVRLIRERIQALQQGEKQEFNINFASTTTPATTQEPPPPTQELPSGGNHSSTPKHQSMPAPAQPPLIDPSYPATSSYFYTPTNSGAPQTQPQAPPRSRASVQPPEQPPAHDTPNRRIVSMYEGGAPAASHESQQHPTSTNKRPPSETAAYDQPPHQETQRPAPMTPGSFAPNPGPPHPNVGSPSPYSSPGTRRGSSGRPAPIAPGTLAPINPDGAPSSSSPAPSQLSREAPAPSAPAQTDSPLLPKPTATLLPPSGAEPFGNDSRKSGVLEVANYDNLDEIL